MEPLQKMVWPLEDDAFGKLPVILVAKAQRQVLVASESKELVALGMRLEVYKFETVTITGKPAIRSDTSAYNTHT